VFVVDQINDRVQVFDRNGVFQRTFPLATPADTAGGPTGRPQGIEVGGSGHLYVADSFQGEVREFDAQGNYLATIGAFGEWAGQLRSPTDVAVDQMSRLLVASPNSGRVEIFGLSVLGSLTLAIVSSHGTATPGPGVYTNDYGSILTNRVSSPDTRGTTQYVCAGWTMTGNSPAGGSTNLMEMVHTNEAVLTWLWTTQFWLSASAGANGAVAPTGAWWDAGSLAAVTAQPDAYYHFSQWTGTVLATTNPLPIPMDMPHRVVALFAANQAAGGTPEWWLASYNLTNGGLTFDQAETGNPDSDSFVTWEEYIADTSPTSGSSFLALSGVQASPTGALIAWHGGVLATQYVEMADELAGTQTVWQTIATNLPPTAVATNFLDPAVPAPRMFYRLRTAR
jgi:hypothetical protein